jgi:hypothetical protein
LNAKYLGVFKTSAYELGHMYAEYFMDGGILSEKQVSRMGEAQIASDMLVSLVGGVQTIKNIERYYKQYDDADVVPDDIISAKDCFSRVMTIVGAIYPSSELKNTNWSRPHWFYTLFTAVAHAIKGLEGLAGTPQPDVGISAIPRWRAALDEISARYDELTEEDVEEVPQVWARFINFAQRRTTDTDARRERAKFLLARVNA